MAITAFHTTSFSVFFVHFNTFKAPIIQYQPQFVQMMLGYKVNWQKKYQNTINIVNNVQLVALLGMDVCGKMLLHATSR